MEELLAKHRKEQRDLQARITQKKKAATKKTRKGVNDECANLERDLKDRQAQEIAALQGEKAEDGEAGFPPDDEETPAEDEQADTKLLESSLQKLSVANGSSNAEPDEPRPKKGNRQKARLARRAAEQAALVEQAAAEAASMPDMKEREQEQMHSHFSKHSLEEKEIRADGHCLYSAIADQLEQSGLGLKPRITPKVASDETENKNPNYTVVRGVTADFIAANPDDFVPFLEEPLESYLSKIRDTGEWGGHIELLALARTYNVEINVLHADGRVDKIEPGSDNDVEKKTIWLGYYRHSSGLGEHYNSLRKVS